MKKFLLTMVSALSLICLVSVGFTSFGKSKSSNQAITTANTIVSNEQSVKEENGVSNFSFTNFYTSGNTYTSPIKFEGVFSKSSTTINLSANDPSLISFLKVTIDSSISYDTITIQCINSGAGAITYNLSTDEYNTPIEQKTRTYYFTRQATYIVVLKLADKTIVATAQCSFSPVINHNALQNMYDNINYIDGTYYILGDGSSEIMPKVKAETSSSNGLKFDTSLYSLSINNVKVKNTTNNVYKLTIPANSYGKLTLTFTSYAAYVTRDIELVVINPSYSWNFYNEIGNNISEENKFGNFYVFNEIVKLKLEIANNLKNMNQSTTIEDTSSTPTSIWFNGFNETYSSTPLELTNSLKVVSTETIRNTANTDNLASNVLTVDKVANKLLWENTTKETDHSIFEISTSLLIDDTYVVNPSVVTYKVITKVPYSSNKYELAIYQHSTGEYHGGAKNEVYNYLNTALDGKLTRSTNVYFLSSSTSIYNNTGLTTSEFYINFDGVLTPTITIKNKENIYPFQSAPYNVTNANRTITIKNDTNTNSLDEESFLSFYSFTFEATYYPQQDVATNRFYSNIISSEDSAFTYTDTSGNTRTSNLNDNYIFSMFKTGSNDGFLANANKISAMPKIEVTSDLKLPVYMNLTYNFNQDTYNSTIQNGNIFWDENGYENFHQLQVGDIIEFTEPGLYIVELYTFPSYEFAKNFVNRVISTGEDSTLNNYYVRFEFEIEGPSISATSTNNEGNTIPLSNRMLTENNVRISINLTPDSGQILRVYKNNIEFNNFTSSATFTMDRTTYAGSWSFTVYDANNNPIKSLSFTIVDTAYLGFSINTREEYEALAVYNSDGEQLTPTHCYDLLDEGVYSIYVANADKVPFILTRDGVRKTVNAEKPVTNIVNVNIQKPYFNITFGNAWEGDTKRTTESISIASVDGIEISKVTVFLDGKQIDTYDPRETAGGIGGIISSGHSYDKNGVYTIRITDKFNNSYEVQAEKYYKVNFALIALIAIAVFGLLFLLWFIYRSRRGIKVR